MGATNRKTSDNGNTSGSASAANLRQSRTLATLRDTLLPKLLSGELSVTETH